MIKQERHARICEYLDKHQFASINTLMEQIGASKSTVRRDLMELQEEKKIAFVRAVDAVDDLAAAAAHNAAGHFAAGNCAAGF